jgi:histidinol-phosphate aminotransferase
MGLTVVLGGTRSGKSARGEALATATGLPVTYVATGAAIDDAMRARIAAHRARRDAAWETVEPGDPLAAALAVAVVGGCALLDGLGGSLATAQHRDGDAAATRAVTAAQRLARGAPEAPGEVIVVAEQAGTGVTPIDAVSRAWVDLLGEVTQLLAGAAGHVELVTAGRVQVLASRCHGGEGALRIHGDRAVRAGDTDHAVNVLAGGPPRWLRAALQSALDDDAGRYPDESAAVAAIARRHGREPAEVVAANGAAEALWLIGPALRPRLAAVVHPGFTESEAALRAHGIAVARVFRDPDRDFALDPDAVPVAADLVVVGHPASPSGTLDSRGAILALRRPGRVLVVDEAFMDLVPGEPGSLASTSLPDVIVVRSLTKALAIPGVRAGYALATPHLADRLRAVRPAWSVNALALAALVAAAEHPAELAARAERAAAERIDLEERLRAIDGVRMWPAHANFLLIEVADGPSVVAALRDRRIAVRHAASFPGLGPGHLRLTAREPEVNARLAAALTAAVGVGA